MNALWIRIVCVAVAGALGAVTRWGTGQLVSSILGKQWPFGTLVINALGCLLFGLVMGFIKPEQAQLPQYELARLTLLAGFCGAYTTYSTFAYDVFELHATRGVGHALLNIAAQLTAGLLAIILGVGLGRLAA